MVASNPSLLRIHHALRRSGQRAYHDLTTAPSRKPIIQQGPPGYSANNNHVVTIFGCTGFLGRYLASKLGRMGTQVIIPYRDEDEARIFKPMGDLGRIVRLEWDIRNEDQIAECLRHSDTVYNLVGRDHETKNFDFKSVHVDGAERIAKIAAQVGVPRFVHISHLNASPTSESKFYRTKAEGEERVKAVFPNATIVRPSTFFGYEDKLLTNMAVWPIWWKLNHGQTKIRPVHVLDVAQALTNLLEIPQLPGTYHLPGPSTLTHEYLLDLVSSVTLHPLNRAPVLPKPVATTLARAGQFVWWPTLSPDEVTRRYIDDSDVPGDWTAFGMGTPSEIEEHALTYLRRYRSAENFVRPVVLPPRPTLATLAD
ncbi:putative rmlD substrate binding domain [Lyophyllum shimeji]|uniref:RmlD substrate binding domain n=1 Tax=Lyophyllum shimeji TaxID=47721 RepID=A0A9P3PN04_LYOSH|nr:putative rmlD substrate binding domain [Lyophyllum shimeji]